METFLGQDTFDGDRLAADEFTGTPVGQADFDGAIAFCNLGRAEVEKLLPSPLELAPNVSATAPSLHPVVFIFGQQSAGATIFGGITFPMGVEYYEFAVAIPFVKHRGGRYLHTFVPRMYSSYEPATSAGNAHYGFGKAMAEMRWQDSIFVITAGDGSLLFHATLEPAGDWVRGASCDLANFAAMRGVFELPIVGRRRDGTYIESYFRWDFQKGRVRPARSALSVDAPLIGGLTPQALVSLPLATFEVQRMIWGLTWPRDCRF